MKKLFIQMFGGVKIWDGPVRVHTPSASKSTLLLARLALSPGDSQERKEIAEWLWPDAESPEQARGSLRTALARLRKELDSIGFPAGAVFEDDTQRLRLKSGCVETDVSGYLTAQNAALRAANAAERRNGMARAAALYKGPFLPAFDENWVYTQRDLYAETNQRILKQLTVLCEAENDWEAALEYARQAFRADSCDDEAGCLLMRLLLNKGQYADAAKIYRRLTDHLQKDLGLPPSQEAKRLAQQARQRQRVPLIRLPAAPKNADAALFSVPALPRPLTRFFGRESEIDGIASLLTYGGRRLVTLTGSGGLGKTRLADEVAQRLLPVWNERIFFVELAPVQDAALLLETIARAMQPGIALPAAGLETIAGMIGERPALLVLDNLEHLLPPARSEILALLRQIPALTLLVTSRERLAVQGETLFPIPPLPLPDAGEEALETVASVRLFLDRANLANPRFIPNKRDLVLVIAICRRLEGIPLSLELAAPWLETLTLTEINDRLAQRFALLVSPYTDVPARHRTLRATIEWSFDLLSDELKRVFTRLAVFRGGWTPEAANTVCEMTHTTPLLRRLHTKSLIDCAVSEETTRYAMLETLRDFAAEQETPAEQQQNAGRHAAYFYALALEAEPYLTGPDSLLWLNRLEAEHDNLQAALDTLLAQKQYAAVIGMTSALLRYWDRRGHTRSGLPYIKEALANYPKADAVRARALLASGHLRQILGDSAASRDDLQASRTLAASLSDPAAEARAALALGHNALTRSDYAASRELLLQSLPRFEASGDSVSIARTYYSLGGLNLAEGRLPEAEEAFQCSLHCWRTIGERHGEARAMLNLASAYSSSKPERMMELLRGSLAIFEDFRDFGYCAVARQSLGVTALRKGDMGEALALLERSIEEARQIGWNGIAAISGIYIGDLRLQAGDFAAAESWYRQSLAQLVRDREMRRVAQAVYGFARLAWKQENHARAARLLSAVDALCRAVGAALEPGLTPDRGAALAAVRDALGFEEFTRHWEAGQAASWEESVAFAQANETI